MEPFVKGERVIAHSDDSRDKDNELIVVSVGKKWITCAYPIGGGELSIHQDKFDVTTRVQDRRQSYRLYHNIDEYLEIERLKELKRNLIRELESNIWSFTTDELLLFKEIHETGLKEWKRLNLKDNK